MILVIIKLFLIKKSLGKNKIDFLKVSHHESGNSSSKYFIDKLM